MPDLVVTDIDPPRDLYEDVDATISVTISNDGQNDINSSFRVTLSVEGDLEDSISIEGLDEGDSIDIDFEWTPSTTGEHNIVVVVDSDDDIVEEDEGNNDRDIDENVISQPEDADLIISDTDLPDSGYVGVPLSLLITLTNAGGLEISKDFTVDLEVDGKSADTATVSGLDDGRKTEIELEWTPQSTGTYSFSITVDSEDDVDESDESNNRETLELDIFEPTAKGDLQLVKADTQTNLTKGMAGSILVTLSNDSDMAISDAFNLQLRLNETAVSSISVASLDSGASVEIPVSYTPDITGAHLFIAIVDPDNIIDESNEDNNHYQFVIDIAPADSQGTTAENHETTVGQNGGGISFTKLIMEPPPFMVAIVLLGASLIIVLVFFLRQRQRGY